MKKVLVSLIFIISSCGSDKPKIFTQQAKMNEADLPKFSGIDPDLLQYVEQLNCDYPKGLGMGFAPIGRHNVAAICVHFNKGYKEITVDPTLWDELSDDQKEVTIFHELGHCIMDRTHENAMKKENGMPISLMNEYIFSDEQVEYYHDHKEDYLVELKSHGKCHYYE